MLRGILMGMAVLAAAVIVFAVWIAATQPGLGETLGGRVILFVGLLAGAGLALWHSVTELGLHGRRLRHLRDNLSAMAKDVGAVPPRWKMEDVGEELAGINAAMVDLAVARVGERSVPDLRLNAVLASISDAMVVITDRGQVSLVNHAAKTVLDAERVRVGTSVFASLERESVTAAVEQARSSGQPVMVELRTVAGAALPARVADLAGHAGAIIVFSAEGAEHRAEIEHDLELHDRPPPVPRITAARALADLPVTVLDTETTGLDVTQDRIVSIGAVRLHGARIYRSAALDRLVRPGLPVPARSTAVHGITDAMVADADDFPTIFARLAPLIEGTVLIGHNLAFDIAMLRSECRMTGIAWPDPPILDTLLLSAALDPQESSHNLEALAERLGVDVRGRHTALGDALVTAEIYVRLLPRLAAVGVTTFGAAQTFSGRAKHFIDRQRAAGW